MTKLLTILALVLVGCNTPYHTCDYDPIQDEPALTCISIPAAEWNYKDGELAPNWVWINPICKGRLEGKWVYGNTDLDLIKETMQTASFLDADLEFFTDDKAVSQYTCYYYNVK